MSYFDCFNGDADGICALTQLRLAHPANSELITGVKRDINLLHRVEAGKGDHVTALDISLDKNRSALLSILEQGGDVFYCDHHFAGEIPEHPRLEAIINTTPDVCTSLLIDRYLEGLYRGWAVVGTFGDNLKKSALGLAKPLDLSESQLEAYRRLGIYINYNGYGAELADLYFHPADLYRRVVAHMTPDLFMAEDAETFQTLENGYHDDMNHAFSVSPSFEQEHAAVFELPDEPWSRRVSGVFGNELANRHPQRAHAVVTQIADGMRVVSVRAPLENKQGADEICRQFETGGGRAAAAGINRLPADRLNGFIDVFSRFYQ